MKQSKKELMRSFTTIAMIESAKLDFISRIINMPTDLDTLGKIQKWRGE